MVIQELFSVLIPSIPSGNAVVPLGSPGKGRFTVSPKIKLTFPLQGKHVGLLTTGFHTSHIPALS